MSYDQILSMLKEMKLPVAYDHFAEGESPAPPFMVFLFPSSDNFAADGQRWRPCWTGTAFSMKSPKSGSRRSACMRFFIRCRLSEQIDLRHVFRIN